MRLFLGLLFASLWLGALIAFPGRVAAHADYSRSIPAADEIVVQSPRAVEVWFTQELFRREGENTLEVYGPDGARVDAGDARIDDDDRTHMIVSLPASLPSGRYTVRWRALSVEDGHSEEGEFAFTVDPEADPNAAPAAATDGPATPTAPAAPAPATASAADTEPLSRPSAALPCAGALLVGGVALVAAWGRRRLP